MCVHMHTFAEFARPRACVQSQQPHRVHSGYDCKALKKVMYVDLSQGPVSASV